MHDHHDLAIRTKTKEDSTTRQFFHHSGGQRTFTPAIIAESLAQQYPDVPITLVPTDYNGCNLLAYAALGFAKATPVNESQISPLKWRSYYPPARRMDKGQGIMADEIAYGKYWYNYKGEDYLLYIVSGRDGEAAPYFPTRTDLQYLIGPEQHVADELVRAATEYANALHDEIWVFDGGYWQKSASLYASVSHSSWSDVILPPTLKNSLRTDVLRFFASRSRYANLRVPWKRGVIYHGPPGNGKTISIKAMMHTLARLPDAVPSLYVRSLSSFAGPEYAVKQIFEKARREAPCLLVFEDLDSLVTDGVRSYFLNEVDGLQVNEGVLMIGSTNHLDRLDPGISKRPSRFDRKYEFAKPGMEERIAYCEFWRGKLRGNEDVEFPEVLCEAIAEETDGFSFAFLQEAFVASLLRIAEEEDGEGGDDGGDGGEVEVQKGKGDDLEKYLLWRVIKEQIRILREEM